MTTQRASDGVFIKARSAETRYRPPRGAMLSPEMRRQALGRGIAVVVIEDCHDDWTRQAVVNEARRQIEEDMSDE